MKVSEIKKPLQNLIKKLDKLKNIKDKKTKEQILLKYYGRL